MKSLNLSYSFLGMHLFFKMRMHKKKYKNRYRQVYEYEIRDRKWIEDERTGDTGTANSECLFKRNERALNGSKPCFS